MGIAKTVKNAFKMVANEDAIILKGVKLPKLKARYQIPIGGIIAGSTIYSAYDSAYEETKFGEIEGGRIANTVNDTYSANLDATIAAAETNPEEFDKTVMGQNLRARHANVNPQIVFALHNLRQGGGE